MFKFCSSIKVQKCEPTDDISNDYSDEIVNQKAFSNEFKLRYVSTKDFNDVDLYNLIYLGSLDYSYSYFVSLFGEPRVSHIYKYHMKSLLWYIKFNNGNICSISKNYQYDHKRRRHIQDFKICGNHRNVLLDLAAVLK